MKLPHLRRTAALILAVATLWMSIITVGATTPHDAANAIYTTGQTALSILRWELGDFFGTDILTMANVLALSQSPLLLSHRSGVTALLSPSTPVEEPPTTAPEELPPQPTIPPENIPQDDLSLEDNGVPAQTVIPGGASYVMAGNVYIRNTSGRDIDGAAMAGKNFSARLQSEGPQVLIIHSHGTESYTMPPGQEYVPSGTYRTQDTNYNMVRIGDEIASVLSDYGISVLHDRTLHDAASYNDAYDSSLASTEEYLANYPTISFVLDVHRDAIQDADGRQYKLVTQSDANVAQCCLVMGLSPDTWADNLQLAVAVQETLDNSFPTLMRPIAARGYRYNQHLSPGSLLVEIGAAGNSLEEAILGARHFADGFARTLLQSAG